MKKKLFTLLTLALCVCSGAWAAVGDTFTVTFNGSDSQTSKDYFSFSGNHNFNSKFNGATYDGVTYTSGLKMESTTTISWTAEAEHTVIILQSTWETVVMVFFSTLFAILLGFPLGIFLFVTSPRGIAPKIIPYQLISRIVNVLRSFPFVILMIVLFPLSRVVLGTAIGTEATIIPLSIAAAPFIARLTETALNEVDKGVIQAAVAMGASKRQVVRKVLIPEALPSIISGVTLTIITLIGYSAMAGAIGGGGLGDLAIRYGYQRFRTDVMIESVVIIIAMVEVIQFLGNKAATLVVKYPIGSFGRQKSPK